MDRVQNSYAIIAKNDLHIIRRDILKIFITIFMLMILILSLSFKVDTVAMEIQETSFNRALVSFGLAKGLNAIISLLQGTELSFTPVGVGLNFSVGEILDPFNDMVERFSWVMLLATVSLGVQKIMLTLSATLFMQIAFGVSVIFSLFLVWKENVKFPNLVSLVFKFFLFLLLLRFSTIVFISLTSLMHTQVLESDYVQASEVIEQTKIELDNINKQNQNLAKEKKSEGMFSGFSSQYNTVIEQLNVSQQLQSLEDSIEMASNNIITLITIFIVETLLLPLLYFWLLLLSIRSIFKMKFDADLSKLLYNK